MIQRNLGQTQFGAMVVHVLATMCSAFVYQPGSPTGKAGQLGQIWDPSVTWWAGKWYAHAMYQAPGLKTNEYRSGWLAVSDDGCHWHDVGPVAPEHPGGDQWWKGFVRQVRGDPANASDSALFVMDHGVYEPGRGNDALRFLTSTDLQHWVENSTSHPDPRWYNQRGRWDHMYMGRDPDGGFIGFAVSSPIVAGFAGTWPGINRSPDGIVWTQHPPLNVSMGGVGTTSIEEGGFEKMSVPGAPDRYFLIGGGGGPVGDAYSMWVFSSTAIDGPYAPVRGGFRLSGGSRGAPSGRFGWLAAWCGPSCDGDPAGTPLISNYITPGANARADVWMLPMRKPVVDRRGRLRLGYWRNNDRLRGAPLPVAASGANVACTGAHGVTWFAALSSSQHSQGAVLNLSMTVSGNGSVGIALEDLAPRQNRKYLQQIDLPGGDYRYFGVNYSDPHACEAACDADSECKAWTYVGELEKAGGYPVPRCCLKNTDAIAPRYSPACTSGFKSGHANESASYTALLVTVGADGGADSANELYAVGKAGARLIDRAGRFTCGAAVDCGVATVTGIAPSASHALLLMFRKGMFEVYIDGLLLQSFVYGGVYPLPVTGFGGRVGIACSGATAAATVAAASLYEMSL